MLRFCQLSYRSGTRYNPDEATFKGRRKEEEADGEEKQPAGKKETAVTRQPKKIAVKVESELGFEGTGAVPKKGKQAASEVSELQPWGIGSYGTLIMRSFSHPPLK